MTVYSSLNASTLPPAVTTTTATSVAPNSCTDCSDSSGDGGYVGLVVVILILVAFLLGRNGPGGGITILVDKDRQH